MVKGIAIICQYTGYTSEQRTTLSGDTSCMASAAIYTGMTHYTEILPIIVDGLLCDQAQAKGCPDTSHT